MVSSKTTAQIHWPQQSSSSTQSTFLSKRQAALWPAKPVYKGCCTTPALSHFCTSRPWWLSYPMRRWGRCYNFFPLPCLFPYLHSMASLLLLCSLLPRDQSVLTRLPILFLSSCTSSLVSPCATGLSHSLVTSLMVTVFSLPSIEFYDLPLR